MMVKSSLTITALCVGFALGCISTIGVLDAEYMRDFDRQLAARELAARDAGWVRR
ncbi:MAG: hypothetical protein LBR94_05665 [Desulfovibrio sp.]|jgi:hypothetical protein|nr:hypothetical protein [Desulfovibrio sp.]